MLNWFCSFIRFLSLGLAVDGDKEGETFIFRQVGKVAALREKINQEKGLDTEKTFVAHCGMAHTRWYVYERVKLFIAFSGVNKLLLFFRATHGIPSVRNCHPHRSDPTNEFTVVHNGIITNYKELRTILEKFGFEFESDTDTEAVAKLAKYIYDTQKKTMGSAMTFTALVKAVCKELVS